MDLSRYRVLSAHQRALVAVAVMLDGHEAGSFLKADSVSGDALAKAAGALSEQPPELRMPFCGTLLRSALKELRESGS